MSTLEYTVSMLETMPEDRLKEVQNYIRYIAFRDEGGVLTEMLTEDALVEQLRASMEKSDLGETVPASVVPQRMRKKYVV